MNKLKSYSLLIVISSSLLLFAACATSTPPAPVESTATSVAEAVIEDTTDPTPVPIPEEPSPTPAPVDPTATSVPAEPTTPPDAEAEESGSDDTAEVVVTDEPVAVTPIEVTYFTPAQTEGPYYPVDKLADQDNELTVLAGATGSPAGQIIEFTGKVYDAVGMPIEGLTVEIWQTDNNGVYLHPNDRGTEQRDRNFQFYGESVTAVDGSYSFRTILPGHYEPRPRHIHVKVKQGGQELLTTQIYFDGDPSLAADGVFLDGGNENGHLVMTMEPGQDANGNPILVGQHDIILSANLSGS
ncbi:MAG: hypothetical protein KDJ97_07275 [Anaerolineae bacterium]|nr:hypothetical protein [Anaerolineae bacterium]